MYSCASLAEARGCPIRKFTDQSLFAAPRNLSQRTTSFIASQCQGIHQMLLSRLMLSLSMPIHNPASADQTTDEHQSRKDYLCSICPSRNASSRIPRSASRRHTSKSLHSQCQSASQSTQSPSRRPGPRKFQPEVPQTPNTTPTKWWSQTGSNRRPQACKASALPTELWPRIGP